MSSTKAHATWLSLLEISGPFLSINTLNRVFPNGLDKADTEPLDIAELKAAYAEWQTERHDPAIHRAWVRYVLQTVLKWEDSVLAEGQAIPEPAQYTAIEHGNETIRPDYVLHERQKPNQLRALVLVYPPEQPLEKAVPKKAWSASPATRLLSLLHATGVRLGLVTNGEQWMLVNAPKEGLSGYISWYAELWGEDRETYRAFVSLLDVSRFFGVADEDTLPALLDESANDAQEVTDQLGAQVREAVEILVRAFDRLDQEYAGRLLDGVGESKLYEASLTVMMRLVFLLSAEERGLFLLGDPLYDQNYAVSTLRAQLHEAADHSGEAVLERRSDAWSRLLATFRLVYFGSAHEDLQLPAYGGSLFDPERFPFLEGRLPSSSALLPQGEGSYGSPPAVNNRTVLHLLDALQILQLKGEARRLSFRALDIEQIGHVYEGLLDHEARRATQVMLGFGGKYEPEIALADLETLIPDPSPSGRREQEVPRHEGEGFRGRADVAKFLKDATGRGESAIKNDLRKTPDGDRLRRLAVVCGDESLFKRVQPYLNLLRDDELGYPVVILPGSVFVTSGTERRATGTHYTPKSLTEPIVQHTLEPLVYVGVAEGAAREDWQLRSPSELLELKVCDMAMGSGAFLVQACRYLGARLVEAWQALEAPSSPTLLPPQAEEKGDSSVHEERETWHITPSMRERMTEIARNLRKNATRSEDILWQAIRNRKLENRKFKRQVDVGPFVLDFYCPEERLAVEIDGGIHALQQEADRQRQQMIESLGIRFVRLSADLVENNLFQALQHIRTTFATPSPHEERVWERGQGVRAIPRLNIFGKPPTNALGEMLIPDDPQERLTLALRLVADRCLYGVDKNPLAVEMGKLSLWLTTLAKGRPFTFLDHALKCGDSLVGVSLEQLANWSLDTSDKPKAVPLLASRIRSQIAEVVALRQKLESFTVTTVEDQREKARLFFEAEAKSHDLRQAGNLLLASYLNDYKPAEQKAMREHLLEVVQRGTDLPEGYYAPVENTFNLPPFHWELEFPEVFTLTLNPSPTATRGEGLNFPSPHEERVWERGQGVRAGFHAFIGNPPFIGGQKITGLMGVPYRNYLISTLAKGQKGSADVCAYFFLRAYANLRPRGTFGLIATNTIAQGDTREVGLDQLVQDGATLYYAENNHPWEGTAAVVVNIVHAYKGSYAGLKTLDQAPVAFISPLLDNTQAQGNPKPLIANAGKSFQGSIVLGMGFVLEPDEAQALIAKDPRNRAVLFPYLNGEDLNSHPEQQPSRWVINFFDWSEEQAMQYPDCYAIVREKAYPERMKQNDKGGKEFWWRYLRPRPELHATIAPLRRVLVTPLVSKYVSFVFQPVDIVYANRLAVFAYDMPFAIPILQSNLHEIWARKYSSTLETRINYSPTDCFETFPFPPDSALASLEGIGETYHETRRQIMLARWEGLTATYNRFHNPKETSADIQHLRELHRQMDEQVALAYGWGDLDLGHDFHDTAQGVRYTLHDKARREVLKRLLALNFERYEEEKAAGLHDKAKGKGKKKAAKDSDAGEAEESKQKKLF